MSKLRGKFTPAKTGEDETEGVAIWRNSSWLGEQAGTGPDSQTDRRHGKQEEENSNLGSLFIK